MKIKGLQKLTLIDYPGKVACTVFTGGCNLRCPFCHNASLALSPENAPDIAEDELFGFLEKRSGILDGVCISGGEPLIHRDIAPFIGRIKSLGYSVKLDTNGCFPEALKALVNEGLIDYTAMDIKNSLEKYALTTGTDGFDTAGVEESAAYLMSGPADYEFRTTVVRELHSERDFLSIGKWLAGAKRYYLQSFTDSGNLIGEGLSAYPKCELEVFRYILKRTIENTFLREI